MLMCVGVGGYISNFIFIDIWNLLAKSVSYIYKKKNVFIETGSENSTKEKQQQHSAVIYYFDRWGLFVAFS